jgi:hypothetical protein
MNNLYCYYCGNKHQWHIDLRLLHYIKVENGSIIVKLDQDQTSKVLNAVNKKLDTMLDKNSERTRPIFRCANCSNPDLDTIANVLETCGNVGCPGCMHCQYWIEEEEMRTMCLECISENSGEVDEEFCYNFCPHYDFGLEDVRQHYAVTLIELIREAGYEP